MVFDIKMLELLDLIVIFLDECGKFFGVMLLDIDEEYGKLVIVSISILEVVIVDLVLGEVKVFELFYFKIGLGVVFDVQDGLIFIVVQDSDNLLIVNVEIGEMLYDVNVGVMFLNVMFELKSCLVFVVNCGVGIIIVVNIQGEIVVNLDVGSFFNQLCVDGQGNVWVVNKLCGEGDDNGDWLWCIVFVIN